MTGLFEITRRLVFDRKYLQNLRHQSLLIHECVEEMKKVAKAAIDDEAEWFSRDKCDELKKDI